MAKWKRFLKEKKDDRLFLPLVCIFVVYAAARINT